MYMRQRLFTRFIESDRIRNKYKEAILTSTPVSDISAVARMAVEAAEDKQARDIVLLDLRKLNTFADFFVICTGESDRQLKAIVEAIDQRVGAELGQDARSEGTTESGWVILDYGDLVIHIFSSAQREFYRIEHLWSMATPLIVVQ